MVMYTLGQHWEMGLRLPYRRCQFWQKKSFQMKLILILADMYASKIVHFGHRKPARIHWKANVPETSHCLMRILVQRHNWAIFRRKWARRRRYSQWRSLSGHVKRIFIKIDEEDIGNIWFQQDRAMCFTAEAKLDVLRPVFEDRIISRRADVV